MKRQKWLVLAAFFGLLGMAVILGCGVITDGILFPGGGGVILHTPKFLVALDDTSTASNVNVFSVDPSTGALTAVSGSPFTTGLSDGSGAVVHPTHGNWVFAADWSGNVQALVIGSDGKPTVASSAASGFTDFGWTDGGLAVTTDGRFLITTTDGADVVVWSIDQTTGALTKVGPYTTPLVETYGVCTTGSFAFITDTNGSSHRQVHVASIGASGGLTSVETDTVPVPSGITGYELWTCAVDKTGRFVYVGDENRTITVYSIGGNGHLTMVDQTTRTGPSGLGDGDMDTISFTPDNKFLVTTTDRVGTDVFAVDQTTGKLTAVTGAPFGTEDSFGSVVVDPSSKFAYVSDDCSDIVAYKINGTSGALTPVSGSPFSTANGCSYGFAVTW